jgi:ABC-type multidrug transport system ATPase subunit
VNVDFSEVTVSDVSRHYGRRRALAKVSLDFRSGEVLGLLGPNGAGKSTLLSILSTLLAPSSGDVRYGTVTAKQAGPGLRLRLGFLSHDLHLYPELTARENLEFFARLYGVGDVAERVATALGRAGLAARADDLVTGFSRGMRQRLALERALLHHPRLLLLDEPFTGLDDASVDALVSRLRELRDDRRIIVVVTHDLDVAERLLDKVAVLREGRLVAFDDAHGRIREHYRAHVATGQNPEFRIQKPEVRSQNSEARIQKPESRR